MLSFRISYRTKAARKNTNAKIASQARQVSKRCHLPISPFQAAGGASGCHFSTRLLIGTVQISVIPIQMYKTHTPAHRRQKLSLDPPSRINEAKAEVSVAKKIMGTIKRNRRIRD
ncbi:MAG TPA: hypothetical protein VGN20_03575 [Mucilaginibacter sp.]